MGTDAIPLKDKIKLVCSKCGAPVKASPQSIDIEARFGNTIYIHSVEACSHCAEEDADDWWNRGIDEGMDRSLIADVDRQLKIKEKLAALDNAGRRQAVKDLVDQWSHGII